MKLEISGPVTDRASAWAAIADTDWQNRAAGNGAVLGLDVEVDESGYPRVIGAVEGPLGTRSAFEEDDNRWVLHRYFRQGRTYRSGLLRRSVYEGRLEPHGDGYVPHITLEVEVAPLFAPVAGAAFRGVRNRLQAHLDGLPPVGRPVAPRPLRELSVASREAFRRWSEQIDEALAGCMLDHLRCARPLELQRMRPWALADRWNLDREAVLVGMIRGVQAGLFELYWSVRCPRCQAQTASTGLLGDLADHADCRSCRIGFGADLAENVEVLFAPHPSLGSRVDETFCSLFPFSAPEIEASFILSPGEQHVDEIELAAGVLLVGAGGDRPDVRVVVEPRASDSVLRWSPETDGEQRLRTGPIQLELRNDGGGRARVQLTRHGDRQDHRVMAANLTTLPEFRRELSHQVLSPDLRIATRAVSLVFTDLTGSTAMYEEVGDARAFAVVRDHFALLRRITEAHGGTVVKTIGDAVMAAFDTPEKALAAGLEMATSLDAWAATLQLSEPPRLRVGVHSGPALVVHSDAAGIDYFGRTVNLAARTQGAAGAGEVLWTDSVHGLPSVQRLVASRSLRPEPVEVELKGLEERTRLHRVRLDPPVVSAPR